MGRAAVKVPKYIGQYIQWSGVVKLRTYRRTYTIYDQW